jgi:hypothetical protein
LCLAGEELLKNEASRGFPETGKNTVHFGNVKADFDEKFTPPNSGRACKERKNVKPLFSSWKLSIWNEYDHFGARY